MAIYCEKCRTRIVGGVTCTTCGYVNSPAGQSTGADSVLIGGHPQQSGLPPPPQASSSVSGGLRWVALVVVAAAIAGVVVFLATRSDSSKTVTIDYSIEVFTDTYCSDFGFTGYDDIPYGEVEVIDGDGTFLGSGTLDSGIDSTNSCLFSAVFEVKRASDGVYRVTVGNANRGYLNYGSDDLVGNRLTVEATLE